MARTGPTVPDDAVFAAVVDVISEVGPTQLTLARIGEKAGLTAGALVLRFGSKHALLEAFAARTIDGVRDRFAAQERRHPTDPETAAIEALVDLSQPLGERRAFANHLAWFALELADPALRAHAARHARSVQTELTRLLGDDELARRLRTFHQGSLVLWALAGKGPLAGHVRRELRAALGSFSRSR